MDQLNSFVTEDGTQFCQQLMSDFTDCQGKAPTCASSELMDYFTQLGKDVIYGALYFDKVAEATLQKACTDMVQGFNLTADDVTNAFLIPSGVVSEASAASSTSGSTSGSASGSSAGSGSGS